MFTYCIAEDEFYVQKSIMGRIQALKLDLECAGCAFTGMEAEELYDRVKPDLFFVDINMPQNDGITFIGNVRKKDPQSRTLFIIISGYSDYQTMHRAITVDVFDYLQKPIVPQEFSTMMDRAVDTLKVNALKQNPADVHRQMGQTERTQADDHGQIEQAAGAWGAESVENEKIVQVCEYIRIHYPEDISARTIGEAVYLSASYLAHKFREYTGTSIGRYLEDVRLEQAQKLLRSTDLQVSQIAERVGYHDGNYFTKCFRKKYHISPSEIRREKE